MIPPGQSGQYWEYDVTLQLEPLSHFCAVYKHFHPSDLIHLVLKKVVRAFLRKASFSKRVIGWAGVSCSF